MINKKSKIKRILVTAGPTEEPLDPVRFISNRSTGLLGYSIAKEAAKRGHKVCLVTGPVTLGAPAGIETIKVVTACEMEKAVFSRIGSSDCLIMAAAVGDYRPEVCEKNKIKKNDGTLSIKLVKNPDILAGIGKRKGFVKIGFALETEKFLENGKAKLKKKQLDLIIVNVKSKKTDPFGPGLKNYIFMDKSGAVTKIKNVTKGKTAAIIVRKAEELMS